MKRVLVGVMGCLAVTSVQADDCTGTTSLAQSAKVPLTVSVNSSTSIGQAGSRTITPYQIKGKYAFDQVDVKQLEKDDNPFTVPTITAGAVGPGPVWPVGCILVPPPDNTAANLTLKGAPGDTGLRISKNQPTLIVFDSAAVPSKIIVTSSARFPTGQVMTVTWF